MDNYPTPQSSAAAVLGRVRSPRKTAAARLNGRKGGRPRLPLVPRDCLNVRLRRLRAQGVRAWRIGGAAWSAWLTTLDPVDRAILLREPLLL